MPFIVQCPHAECRKFMLLEDSTRGSTVECLLCKRAIKVDTSSSVAAPPAAAKARGPAWSGVVPGPPAARVQSCPHCKSPLRLPAGKTSEVKCPKCGKAFKV